MRAVKVDSHVTRRQALSWAAVSTLACTTLAGSAPTDAPMRRTGMGLVIYDCNIRRRAMQKSDPTFDLFEPAAFLRHCRQLGAGGMQVRLGVMEAREIATLRDLAEQSQMYIEGIIRLPQDRADLSRFEAEIQTAHDAGAVAVRTTIIPGRRYERFKTLAAFREAEHHGKRMLERAVPILEKHQVHLAVENHKDQRIEERVGLFQSIDSAYVGACIDTGNSIALLDGIYEPIEDLAPYVRSVHLKDQALQQYQDGFLLGDIPLGQGSLDMKRIVAIIKQSNPKVNFSLELITRDPLRVPCLTKAYYATMPALPARDLAATLRFVREHSVKRLQQVSALPEPMRLQLEDNNIAASLDFAGLQLGL